MIVDMVDVIKDLKKQNEKKEKRIARLYGRIADLEQYTHMNDVMLEIRPRSMPKHQTVRSSQTLIWTPQRTR